MNERYLRKIAFVFVHIFCILNVFTFLHVTKVKNAPDVMSTNCLFSPTQSQTPKDNNLESYQNRKVAILPKLIIKID